MFSLLCATEKILMVHMQVYTHKNPNPATPQTLPSNRLPA